MTFAGVFGIVAESLATPSSRWWTSAAFAMQTLGILIAQLAVIQLLTPDYLFGLLSINPSTNTLPPWRIYALILITLLASVISLISVFVVPRTPSLHSSVPTLVSLSLPLPLLFSLARIINVAQSSAGGEPPAMTIYTKQNSKCTDLELSEAGVNYTPTTLRFPRIWAFAFALQSIAVLSVAGQVAEGALGYRAPVVQLFSTMGLITWGGGVMTIHFIIIYEPRHRSPMAPSVDSTSKPSHGLERVTDQPSEDFMTLKDPFASPTQAGFPLPPSPPRAASRRQPRRRASEPLQLKRFGSFAALAEDVKEKQAGTEDEQDMQFLEGLVRHAWFSTGSTDSDSMRNNAHEGDGSPSTPAQTQGDVFTAGPPDASGASTPTIRQEAPSGPEAVSPSILLLHPFRPVTPPRPANPSPWTPYRYPNFPEPPTSFPFSSPSSVASLPSLPLSIPAYPAAHIAPHSPGSSESGSSFVSPPPTPTPEPSRQHSRRTALVLTPAKPLASLSSSDQAHRPIRP
ncbi:hypothetical protein FRC11_011121 [Ceratobasidium sp. 423]|nr:hypothetical protein FRC11_011121 [Ceratobasidium sp. 423]